MEQNRHLNVHAGRHERQTHGLMPWRWRWGRRLRDRRDPVAQGHALLIGQSARDQVGNRVQRIRVRHWIAQQAGNQCAAMPAYTVLSIAIQQQPVLQPRATQPVRPALQPAAGLVQRRAQAVVDHVDLVAIQPGRGPLERPQALPGLVLQLIQFRRRFQVRHQLIEHP